MAQAFGVGVGASPFGPMEDQVRRNMEMFEKAFSMFTPFARRETGGQEKTEADKPATSSEDIDALKRQIDEMQRRIDKISDKD
jgi:polyhydroxyalkanoate synthesis regulator protein